MILQNKAVMVNKEFGYPRNIGLLWVNMFQGIGTSCYKMYDRSGKTLELYSEHFYCAIPYHNKSRAMNRDPQNMLLNLPIILSGNNSFRHLLFPKIY